MLIEIYIALQILFLVMFGIAFWVKSEIWWGVTLLLGVMISISSFNIQQNTTILDNETTNITANYTITSYEYDTLVYQNVSYPLVYFNYFFNFKIKR